MGRRTRRSTLRIISTAAAWSAWAPWLKFRRKTSAPALNSSSMRSGLVVAGPRVAMIFTRLRRGGSAMGDQRGPGRSAVWLGWAGQITFWPS